jgi:excisionase family DNA binding protein
VLGVAPESLLRIAKATGELAYNEVYGTNKSNWVSIHVKRADVVALQQKWQSGVTASEAAQIIGVSVGLINALVDEGLIKLIRGPEVDGSQVRLVSQPYIDRFLVKLKTKTKRPLLVEGMSLLRAVQTLSAYGYGLAKVVRHILQDEVAAYWYEGATFLHQMQVSQEDIGTLLAQLSDAQPLVTRQKIAQQMGVKIPTVSTWVEDGHLTPIIQEEQAMYFTREDADDFMENTITTEEASDILGISTLVVQKWVRQGRLKPITGPGINDQGHYRFRREDIVRLRPDNRLSARQMAQHLGIGRSQLTNWIRAGRIQPVSGPGIDECKHYLFILDEETG